MIPVDLARQTAAYLENAGADTTLVEIPGADHFVLAKERPAIFGKIDEWMDRALSKPTVTVHRKRETTAGLDVEGVSPSHPIQIAAEWEAAVQLDVEGANPFDPMQVSVVGTFKHTSGEQYAIPGFWCQDYEYTVDRSARAERLAPIGDPGFRVRFSPPMVGEYAYSFEVTTSTGTKTIPGGKILAGPPDGKGPLRRGRSTHYLQTSKGEGVFLIGQNVAWSTDKAPLDDLLRYVNEIADTGQNFLRLWHCTWCLGYEHEQTGRYDLERAWKLDRLLAEAEKRGVYIMFCFDNAYDVREKKSPYWRSLDGDSKGIATREEFFTSPAARKAFQNRMRYAFARWGHSAAIGAWEFINEMEYIVLGPLELNSAVRDRYFRPWLDEMSAFAEKWDAHGHLLSNSLAVDRIWDGMNRMPWLDLVQHHAYLNAWDTDGAGKALRNLSYISDYGKPYLLGEFGGAEAGVYGAKQNTVNLRDTHGIHLHNSIWASALSGACGTPLTWWWDTYVRPQKLYHHYAALSKFLQGTPWLDGSIRPVDLSTSDVRILMLRGSSWTLVWAQNPGYTWENAERLADLPPVGPLEVLLDGMAPGQYQVEWWDTLTGEIVRTQQTQCRGSLPLTIPPVRTDVAVKVLRRQEGVE